MRLEINQFGKGYRRFRAMIAARKRPYPLNKVFSLVNSGQIIIYYQ